MNTPPNEPGDAITIAPDLHAAIFENDKTCVHKVTVPPNKPYGELVKLLGKEN